MTYMERIATEPAADLIAAEVDSVKWNLANRYPTAHIWEGEALKNRAVIERILGELRRVWTLANHDAPTWREALSAWVDANEAHCGASAKVRYRLIAEHSPARATEAA